MDGKIKKIICNWNEFDAYKLSEKYNLVDFGEDERYKGYQWFYDSEKDVNVYVR